MGNDTFRDFIPAGEKVGATGNGFTDFVPNTPTIPPFKAESTPKVEPTEPKKDFVCDVCKKEFKNALGLMGHKRSHVQK